MAIKKTPKEVIAKETVEVVAERIKKEAAKLNVLATKEITDAENMSKNLETLLKMPFISDEYKEIISNGLPSIKTMIEKAKDVLGIDYKVMETVDAINTHNIIVENLENEKNVIITELDEKIASLEDTYDRKNKELEQAHIDAEADWNRRTELAHRSLKNALEDDLEVLRKRFNDDKAEFYADKMKIEEYEERVKELEKENEILSESINKAKAQGEAIGKQKAETEAEHKAALRDAEYKSAVAQLTFQNQNLEEKLKDAIEQRDEAREDAREAQKQLKEVSLGFANNASTTVNFSSDRK